MHQSRRSSAECRYRHRVPGSVANGSNPCPGITTRWKWLAAAWSIAVLLATPLAVRGQLADSHTPEVLTLEQAVALALGHNRMVNNAVLEAEKYEDKLAATRTRRFPAFNLYTLAAQQLSEISFLFERGVFGTFPGIGPIPPENTALTTPLRPTAVIIGQISQPLSQQHKIGLSLEQLKVGREIAHEEVRSQRQSTVYQVKQAYYGILQAQSGLQSAEEATRLYRELDRVTSEYVIQQVALSSDSLEVKTQLAQSEYEMLRLSDLLTTQKEQLNHLLGRDIRTEFSVSAVPEATRYETDLAAAGARALEQRPEAREARLKIKQAEYDVRAKKAEYIPDVSLNFNYLSLQNFDQFLPKNIAGVGIVLSWEVFDWGRKKQELAEKTKTVGQANNGLIEAESAVLLEVNGKFRKLQETRQQLRTNYKPSKGYWIKELKRGYVDMPATPLYPFGYGLSYARFEYSNLRIEPAAIRPAGEAHVSVDVKNLGDRAGEETVQLYIHETYTPVATSAKQLRGVPLKPGEKKTVTLDLMPEDLQLLDIDMQWRGAGRLRDHARKILGGSAPLRNPEGDAVGRRGFHDEASIGLSLLGGAILACGHPGRSSGSLPSRLIVPPVNDAGPDDSNYAR